MTKNRFNLILAITIFLTLTIGIPVIWAIGGLTEDSWGKWTVRIMSWALGGLMGHIFGAHQQENKRKSSYKVSIDDNLH